MNVLKSNTIIIAGWTQSATTIGDIEAVPLEFAIEGNGLDIFQLG